MVLRLKLLKADVFARLARRRPLRRAASSTRNIQNENENTKNPGPAKSERGKMVQRLKNGQK